MLPGRRRDRRLEVPRGRQLPGDLGEICPLHVLHDVEERPPSLAGVQDLDHIRMLAARERVDLAAEASDRDWVVRERRGEHLERHEAPEALLLGEVDHAHSALAELAEEVVVPDAVGAVGLLGLGRVFVFWGHQVPFVTGCGPTPGEEARQPDKPENR